MYNLAMSRLCIKMPLQTDEEVQHQPIRIHVFKCAIGVVKAVTLVGDV